MSICYCTVALVLGAVYGARRWSGSGRRVPPALCASCCRRAAAARAQRLSHVPARPDSRTSGSPPASLAAGAGQGSVRGVTGLSTTEKAFNCLNALGSIGFACELAARSLRRMGLPCALGARLPLRRACSLPLPSHHLRTSHLPHTHPPLPDSVSNVLIEITDTMRQPPSAVAQMRRAVNVALSVAAAFYCGVGILGYASLGDATPSLVLSGFTGVGVGRGAAAGRAGCCQRPPAGSACWPALPTLTRGCAYGIPATVSADAPKWALLVAHFAIVVGM